MSVERLERFLRENPAGIEKLFTAAERGAVPHAAHLAESFALKEAAMKALGGLSGWELDWREIESVHRRNAVEIRLSGKVKAHAKKLGVGALRASVSRMGGKVLATVLAESAP